MISKYEFEKAARERHGRRDRRKQHKETILALGIETAVEVYPRVDKNNRVVGYVLHPETQVFSYEGIIRKVRVVIVRRSEQDELEIGLQKRSRNKRNYPGLYEITSEHPNVNQQTGRIERKKQTLKRGLQEEINLEGKLAIVGNIHEYIERPSIEDQRSYWIDTFIAIPRGPLLWQEEQSEVERFAFVPVNQLRDMLANVPEQFIPLARQFLSRFLTEDNLSQLEALFDPESYRRLKFRKFGKKRRARE